MHNVLIRFKFLVKDPMAAMVERIKSGNVLLKKPVKGPVSKLFPIDAGRGGLLYLFFPFTVE